MKNVIVIGAGSQWRRTTLARSIGRIMAEAVVETRRISSWSYWGIDYQCTPIHRQMGWVGALHKDMRTQQRRKDIHQRYNADRQRRLKKEAKWKRSHTPR